MNTISLSKGTFSISSTLTATTLFFLAASDYVGTPIDIDSLEPFSFTQREWEEAYRPTLIQSEDYYKLEIIEKFADNLLSNSNDIPYEFAKILNDEFWEIV